MTAYASKSGRLENLLSLKGLACVLVVAYHVVTIDATGAHIGPDYGRLWQFCDVLSHLRMPLFAFLAGYVFSMRPVVSGTFRAFISKKLTRLYLPAVVVGMLYLVVSLLVSGTGDRHEQSSLLRPLIYSSGQYWFIQALIVIFLVVGLAEIHGFLSSLRKFALVLLVAIAVHLLGNSGIQLFSLGGAAYLLPFFVMGIGLHRFSGFVPSSGWFVAAVAGVFAVTFLVHVAGVFGLNGVRFERQSFMALLLSASSLLVVLRLLPSVGSLDFVGRYSFTIFLFHTFFIAAMRKVGSVAGMDQDYLFFVASLAAGVLGPIVVERIARQLPDPLQVCLIGSAGRRMGAATG